MMIARKADASVGARRLRINLVPSLAGVVVAAVLCGCGARGPERVVASGTVTYNGRPISNGEIRFVPVQTSSAPTAGSFIVDGQYRVDAHGGIAVGTYNLQIQAFRPILPKSGSRHLEDFEIPREQYLPKKYNANTKLQMAIEPGSREIIKNFDLTD